jgi:mycofactocin precursor
MENDTLTREAGTDVAADLVAENAGVEEELLIEEISIDGMCGVY